ncbi:B-cell receptor CD22 [Lates calcarifer]|uniref:B-cell receptor CD22 n=1 Tax=Lates calcarifer TaxID=8187 RepID=A0AAJ7LS35_LATCA|nr:B-cell receptor CD22 [Lates calcarifer]XP_018529385.2 B-cell receptor CD22 [Lates calcarifer]
MAALCVNTVTVHVLLSVFFLSGALDGCPDKSDLFITVPQGMEALSGSCLQIPCNYSTKPTRQHEIDYSRETYVQWIKNYAFPQNPGIVVFDSSKTDNEYTMNISGNLSQNYCTTLFYNVTTEHTGTYYFRFYNSPFVASAICDHLDIIVKDSPQSPTIKISGELREKESLSITCSALTPCPHSPPKLTWSLQQDSANKLEENKDRTFTAIIQETIILSDKHDGYNITCSAGYPVNEGQGVKIKTAGDKITLNVSYAPKDTSASISPSVLESVGGLVNLTCSSRANPPVSNFTLFKRSRYEPMNISREGLFSFFATEGGAYFCVATNDVGNETSTDIYLTIKSEGELQWLLITGLIIGIICLIIIVIIIVCVWRSKSTNETAQQTQSQTGEELTVRSASKTEEENVHYGEINFSNLRHEPPPDSQRDSRQEQDTVYAQVKVSGTVNRSTYTSDGLDDLYTQVK